jgi:multidrug efflux system outer membrane protein
MRRLLLVLTISSLAVTACTLGPDYERPVVTPPATYRGVVAPDEAASIADLPWVERFEEPELAALIEQAVNENLDLRLALARIDEYRARAAAAKADLGPTLSGTAGAQPRARTSSDDSWLRSIYSLGLAFTWEIDFFGRLRRASEAARADLLATEDGARAVMTSLVADVAQSWFELRVVDELIDITRRNVELQQASLDLTRLRIQGGVAAGIDEQQALSQLAATRAELPSLEQQAQQIENRLSVLLGRPPGPVARPATTLTTVVPPDIPVGLPAALLERRPDIRQAEQQLAAATARVGVAMGRAFPFPRIGLTAFFGSLSTMLNQVFSGDESGVFSWGPTVDWTLIDSGRGTANIDVAKAQVEQAVIGYRRSILVALREVADTLVQLQKIRERIAEQQIQVGAARETLRLSDIRYRGGVTDYLEVLDAQRVLFTAETSLARSRQAELVASVQLYRALGGGWSDEELARLLSMER